MLKVGDLSAWIAIEGSVAPEYGTQVSEEENKISCWIPSEAGKGFAVHYTATTNSTILAGKLYIDGVLVIRPLLTGQSWQAIPPTVTGDLNAMPVSLTEDRTFVFSTLLLTDDDSYASKGIRSSVGEISLEVWTAGFVGYTRSLGTTELPGRVVHETSHKAGSHCVIPGKSLKKKKPTRERPCLVPLKKLAAFTFKYRPLEILQAMNIAPLPRPPCIPSHQGPRKASPCSDQDIKPVISTSCCCSPNSAPSLTSHDVPSLRLPQDRLDTFENASPRVKRRDRIDVDDEPLAKRVKKEITIKLIPGEVIDLTDD